MEPLNIEPRDDLARYIRDAWRFPILSAEDEAAYVRRWQEDRDPEALRQLVGSHLRLVIKIARGQSGYGLPLADLISQGNLGLMRAVEKFDLDRGVRFSTYAMWWIRAAIQEYVLQSWSLVKIGTTASQKKLFFNLRRMKSRMQAFDQVDLSPEMAAAIAEELDVSESEVTDMNDRLGASDRSLNQTLTGESEDEWQDVLVEESADPEAVAIEHDEMSWRRRLLEEGLIVLNERERRILGARRLKDDPVTLEALGREYGISRERVRQIENRAFQKLQAAVRDAARAGAAH